MSAAEATRAPRLGGAYPLLLSASLASDLAGSAVQVAIMLHVFHLTNGNVSMLGLQATMVLVPRIFGAPIGGALSARHSPRWVLLADDAVRIPCTLLILASNGVAALVGLQALLSAIGALHSPARQSLLPLTVPDERLHLANSAMSTANSSVLVAGPVLGAVLYSWAALPAVVAPACLLYFAATIALAFVSARPRAGSPDTTTSFLAGLSQGGRRVRTAPDLRQIAILTLAAGATVGLLVPLLRPFVTDVLHGDDRTYGLLMGAFGLGGVIGPAVGYAVARRIGVGSAILVGFSLEPTLMLLWAHCAALPVSLAIMFVWGIAVFMLVPCQSTYVQRFAEPDFVAPTFALLDQAASFAELMAALFVTMIARLLSPQTLLTVAAASYLAVTVWSWRAVGGRLMQSRPFAPAPSTVGESS